MAPVAFATFADIWAGSIDAQLIPFRTRRRGAAVTRYRWQGLNGQLVGGYASPFVTVEGALAAVSRHACFSNVRKA